MSSPLVHEKVWVDKYKYEEAEKQYFERLSKQTALTSNSSSQASTAVTATTPTPIVSKMPETASVTPSVSPAIATAAVDTEQDKKKKRRKRNSNSGANTTANIATNNVAPGVVAINTVVGNSATIQETSNVTVKENGTDKKVKEKKNEASKKGKKQSPEPKQGSPANPPPPTADEKCSLANEVAKARQHIKSSLECVDRISNFSNNAGGADLVNRLISLEKENEGLRKLVEKMKISQDKFESRLNDLEKQCSSVCVSKPTSASAKPAAAKPAAKPTAKKDDDDDVDLFGSESEDEDDSSKKVREQRIAEYASKKSNKPVLIAKSNVILDVKPWDDETDMKELEKNVRTIKMDGLLFGASKLVPLAYGIHKLQISCVVEDEKVSIDLLTETIEELSDFVQSVDIAAFNKI